MLSLLFCKLLSKSDVVGILNMLFSDSSCVVNTIAGVNAIMALEGEREKTNETHFD